MPDLCLWPLIFFSSFRGLRRNVSNLVVPTYNITRIEIKVAVLVTYTLSSKVMIQTKQKKSCGTLYIWMTSFFFPARFFYAVAKLNNFPVFVLIFFGRSSLLLSLSVFSSSIEQCKQSTTVFAFLLKGVEHIEINHQLTRTQKMSFFSVWPPPFLSKTVQFCIKNTLSGFIKST